MRYEDHEGFRNLFGELNTEQLWVLTKLAKHVRLRCRNNTAFNNYMDRMFPYARFRQVTKQHADGSTYPGLSILIGENEMTGEDDD